ncbi:MAG: 4-(cytidine 5'-diphospho)-2-C-methyl-D-erythritol kinase [Defluviitaleaceae bacterium]|nr:4-(cytidine 5'-diphospho)-2-C-methyl-D-erythritol kinase [Defluviitaleaceae bacterium]
MFSLANPTRAKARDFKSPLRNPRSPAGGFVKLQAFAKINLFLDVVAKRSDGYHDIFSVMQSVSLSDEIELRRVGGSRKVRLVCDEPTLPTDGRNLVVKAADALIRECGIFEGIDIFLTKRIPSGAGLAGGSSDCAATLLGINELFNLNISLRRLLEIGKSLGADVPFCLTGGTAITEGIGEKITPIRPCPPCCIVVATPEIHISTPEIFSRLDAGNFNNVPAREKFLFALNEKNNSKKNISQIANSLYNVFTPITAALYPEIFDLIAQLKGLGAEGAEMSGTGSAVFAVFADKNAAESAAAAINCKAFICTPVILTNRNFFQKSSEVSVREQPSARNESELLSFHEYNRKDWSV